MAYLSYYLLLVAAQSLSGFGLSWPTLLAAAAVAWLLQRCLPDPYLLLRQAARVRRLRMEIAENPRNVTARRDLAMIWLERRRPGRALPLLREARRLDPECAELALLLGKALVGVGRDEEALEPLVDAAARNPRVFYGEAYLIAGRALHALGRFDEAEDALARYLAIHSSSVEGWVRLASARRERRDRDGALQAMRMARATFREVPRFRQRIELLWYLRARLMAVGLA